MKFMGFEARQRVRYVERAQSELIDGLSDPTVQHELGEQALELLEIAQDIYVPNIRFDVISEPLKYHYTDATPVMVARPGEEYWIGRSLAMMNRSQAQNYAGFLAVDSEAGYQPSDIAEETTAINRRLKNSAPFGPVKLRASSLAAVEAVRVPTDKFKQPDEPKREAFSAWGRPLVLLSFRRSDYPSSVFLHELNHVKQFGDTPVLSGERSDFLAERWSQEYESYELSVRYHNALIGSGVDRYPGLVSSLGASALRRSKAVVKSMTALVGNNPGHKPAHMTPDMLDYMGQLGYTA